MDPNQKHYNAYFNFLQSHSPPPNNNNPSYPSISPNSNVPPPNNNLPYPPITPNSQYPPYFPNPQHQFSMPYPYQHPMYPPPHTNLTMGNRSVQLVDEDPETPGGSISSSQVPPFSTQVGLENIDLEEDVGSAKKTKTREKFSPDEDKFLIQSWINISKDPIIGNDQKTASFWARIKSNYNEHRDERFSKREVGQLKSRWHRLNSATQKFAGCYKQAVEKKKSGSNQDDIMSNAYLIYSQDEEGKKFEFEHAWRLLKDEPKWAAGSFECSSKRTKISASGEYSSSPNPPTPTSSEYNPTSPILERPMGQKAAKRKAKGKQTETSTAVNIDEFNLLSQKKLKP